MRWKNQEQENMEKSRPLVRIFIVLIPLCARVIWRRGVLIFFANDVSSGWEVPGTQSSVGTSAKQIWRRELFHTLAEVFAPSPSSRQKWQMKEKQIRSFIGFLTNWGASTFRIWSICAMDTYHWGNSKKHKLQTTYFELCCRSDWLNQEIWTS